MKLHNYSFCFPNPRMYIVTIDKSSIAITKSQTSTEKGYNGVFSPRSKLNSKIKYFLQLEKFKITHVGAGRRQVTPVLINDFAKSK